MNVLPVVTEGDLSNQKQVLVRKTGRTTSTTTGILPPTNNSLTIRVDTSFAARGFMIFYNCYSVIDNGKSFFERGDSGSGVFVFANDGTFKPLGIAFASLKSQTAVCKIKTILDRLDLVLVDRLYLAPDKEEAMDASPTPSKGKKRKIEERINVSQKYPDGKKRKTAK